MIVHDAETGEDCPHRKKGCAAECAEWKEYEKRRGAKYDQAQKDRAAYYHAERVQRNYEKRAMRERRRCSKKL